MLTYHLKMALRHYRRQPGSAALYVIRLVLGMASALVIFLIVDHQTSYDQQLLNGNRLYRVSTENIDEHHVHPGTFIPLPDVLRREVPEVEVVAPIWREWGALLSVPGTDKHFKESVFFADFGLFHLLDYQWLSGDARTALSQPNTVVLTRSYAQKLFGTPQATGKIIRFANKQDLLVTGVLADHPTATNFPLDVLVSWATLKRVNPDYGMYQWNGFGDNFQVYALLKNGVMPEQVMSRSPAILTKYKDKEAALHQRFALTSLVDLHYEDNFSGRQASRQLLRVLSLIGLFVLLIACINFINLTTAQALKRTKEIGIRKAVGSNRRTLIDQFLTESGLITFVAALLSWLITGAVLPAVSRLMAIPLSSGDLFTGKAAAFMTGLFVLTALLAGAYPAIRLSGMPPIWALKDAKVPGGGQVLLRNGLVVVQFTISLMLMSSTLLIYRQLSLLENADLGFDKNAILTVGLPDNGPQKLQTLRRQLMQSSRVKNVSFSFNSASAESNWMQGIQYRKGVKATAIKTQMKMVDAHYVATYGIRLIAGESFRENDTLPKVIANEVFLSRAGINYPQDAIGQRIYYGDGQESALIIGVVKTFHVNSLHQTIDPTLLVVKPKHFYQASIKLASEKRPAASLKTTLAFIEKVWVTTFPNQPFEYTFLDETLAKAYENETRTALLIETAMFIAILIACLGLFGLAAFTAEQRTKEIGVRKVLGASVASIVTLLSKDFLKLVLIAIVIVSLIAWYVINKWLRNFAYRIDIEWWIFALAGLLAVGIALLTVSFQSVKAALLNPVKSLRSE